MLQMQCGAFIVLLPHQAQEYHDRFVRLMGNDPELRSADSWAQAGSACSWIDCQGCSCSKCGSNVCLQP